jgi:hypothetical protein
MTSKHNKLTKHTAIALAMLTFGICQAETLYEHTPLLGSGDGIGVIDPVSFDDLNKSDAGAAEGFKIAAWKLGNLTANQATWNATQYTGYAPPSYTTLRRQESRINTPGNSIIQGYAREWGGYMRSDDQMVSLDETNGNISIRYTYKWPSSTDIRPWSSSIYGAGAKLRLSAKICTPFYNDFGLPASSRAEGLGQMNVLLQDVSTPASPRSISFIVRWLDKRGFITSSLQSPRQTLNGADGNDDLVYERATRISSGEESIMTQFMNGTRYCTKTAASSVSRTNPANWTSTSLFEVDITRAQLKTGLHDLNLALRQIAIDTGIPFDDFSEEPNQYRLNVMNVGIEGALHGSSPDKSRPLRISVRGKDMRAMTVTP